MGISARPVANSVSFHKFCIQENSSLVALPVNKCWHDNNDALVVGNYYTVSFEHQHTVGLHAHLYKRGNNVILCCPSGMQCTKDDMQAVALASTSTTTLLADQSSISDYSASSQFTKFQMSQHRALFESRINDICFFSDGVDTVVLLSNCFSGFNFTLIVK